MEATSNNKLKIEVAGMKLDVAQALRREGL
jgi:hypothetical protein